MPSANKRSGLKSVAINAVDPRLYKAAVAPPRRYIRRDPITREQLSKVIRRFHKWTAAPYKLLHRRSTSGMICRFAAP